MVVVVAVVAGRLFDSSLSDEADSGKDLPVVVVVVVCVCVWRVIMIDCLFLSMLLEIVHLDMSVRLSVAFCILHVPLEWLARCYSGAQSN